MHNLNLYSSYSLTYCILTDGQDNQITIIIKGGDALNSASEILRCGPTAISLGLIAKLYDLACLYPVIYINSIRSTSTSFIYKLPGSSPSET